METYGDLGISGLQNLQKAMAEAKKGGRLRFENLRWLRSLYTKSAKDKVMPLLLSEKVDLKQVEAAAKDAAHEMWVAWHWTKGNPCISPDHGVSRVVVP